MFNHSKIVTALFLFFLAIDCKGRKEISKPGYIIGTNDIERLNNADLEQVSIPTEVLEKAIQSSVLIVTLVKSEETDKKTGKIVESENARFCSGSLIHGVESEDRPRIITNHHCFAKKDAETKSTLPDITPEACVKTTVHFDFSTAEEEMTRKCLPGSLVTSYSADLAMFTLAEELPDRYDPFEIWSGEVPSDRRAFLIHHPSTKESGEGKSAEQHLSNLGVFPKKAITVKNCRVLGRFEQEFWPSNPNIPFGLRHTCDLVHGSSGSGLIDAETGQLLGVNWGGITLGTKRKDNVASSAEFLRQFIDSGEVTPPPIPQQKEENMVTCAVIGGRGLPISIFLLLIIPTALLFYAGLYRHVIKY